MFKLHEMKLNVLARCEMAAPRRVFIRNLRQHAKLHWLEHTRCDLDAQHLESRLPLAVGAMLQAKRAELLISDFAALELPGALFKTHDLPFNLFPPRPPFNFPLPSTPLTLSS